MANKKKILITAAFVAFALVVLYFVIALIINFLLNKFTLDFMQVFTPAFLFRREVWMVWLVALVGIGIFAAANYKVLSGKSVTKRNELEDNRWMTLRDIKHNPSLKLTRLSALENETDGIPLYAKKSKNGKDIDILLAKKPIHTMAIGTTGSGKTSGFVDPVMQILSRCKSKPCMVITDPKGELYSKHGVSLQENGYKVLLIDLDDMYSSAKWNPFNDVFIKTDAINNDKITNSKGRYYYLNKEYLTYQDAEKARAVRNQQLNDEIYQDIQDIIYTVCPVENKNDSTWQKGARDLIFALALAFWEDVRDGLMTKKQFNLYNLYKNISVYCDNECAEFKEYFDNRDKFSKTRGLANTVLISQDKTLTSYLGDVNQYFNWMADNGIASLTSENEVELSKFDEEPTALFLRIPDHKETRYKIVKLFVTQMYKSLVDKASHNEKLGVTKEAELLRNVYFIMDEFVNMPKFDNIVEMIRVGRSRKIFLVPIIQDYAGLDAKYTKEIATSIKSGCNIKVFIGTTDQTTAEEYSKMCGKRKVRVVSYSEQKDLSVSSQAQERPLIYPSELMQLNDPPHRMGNAIVLAFGKEPLRSEFAPLFKTEEIYNIPKGKIESGEANLFEEADYFYDIQKRNAFVREEIALEKEQQARFAAMIAECNSAEQHEATQQVDAEQLFRERVKERLLALTGRVSNAEMQNLLAANVMTEQLSILDRLIDDAMASKNNFLVFELAKIKTFIINAAEVIIENTKEGNQGERI